MAAKFEDLMRYIYNAEHMQNIVFIVYSKFNC